MTTQLTRGRARAAALALCGIAAIAITACAAPAPDTAAKPQQAGVTVAAGVPVVVDCAGHAQTRPGGYTLPCASGGAELDALHWASWGSSAAFAEGTSTFDDCVPSCVGGQGRSFPVLVALWRAEPRPGHAGQRYFTRLTIIYTGSLSYSAGGKVYHLPATQTDPLSPDGGAGLAA